MRFRPLAALVLAIALPLAVVACSEDSTGKHSESEIADELVKVGWPEDQAECLAPTVKELDFTESETRDEETLAKTAKGKKLTEAIAECSGTTGPAMLDEGS
ncbi:MAG: hypothetical protein KF906_09240 [Actinobacteria bacterium]|nr:hypothetical protein [Actinomycetota bacterium]